MADGASNPAGPSAAADLEATVDQAIAACDGDARAAVRSLLVAIDFLETESQALRQEVAALTAAVSRGYARGAAPILRKRADKASPAQKPSEG